MDGFKIDHYSLEEAEHPAPASQHHEEEKEAPGKTTKLFMSL